MTQTVQFYYNGIKDEKGGKLQTAWYSKGGWRNFSDDVIKVYARGYCRFSEKVKSLFDVENNSDPMSDYFEDDAFFVMPEHPQYADVLKAYEKQEARMQAKRNK